MRSSLPEVLVLSPDFPPARGGIQILTHRVIASWTRLRPVVITLDAPDAQAFDARQDFRVVRVPELWRRSLAVAGLSAVGAGTAVRQRPRAVLSAHIITSPGAVLAARSLGVPLLQYVHAKELGAKPGLARFALSRADSVIAVSEYTRGLAEAAGASPQSVRLINPGVDLPHVDPQPIDARPGPPTILSIARLEDRYKGHDVVMRAMPLIRARVPGVRWVIVGDGHLRPTLERRARALGVEKDVEFRGSIDDADRDELLANAHVFCMVSRLPAGDFAGEGFGIVYLEANAYGLPVVAGNVGGATDAVVDGETGILVDPRDHVAVAEAHIRLLTDPALGTRLGRQGRERAQAYAWPNVSRRIEDLIEETTRLPDRRR